MKIRSITYFFHPHNYLDESSLKKGGKFASKARSAFEDEGYEVQSSRLATTPFPGWLDKSRAAAQAQELEKAAGDHGYNYLSLGPAFPEEPDSYNLIPEVLAATQAVFLSGTMAPPGGEISMQAVKWCAGIIRRASTITPDGFGNLRFAALANVPAGIPFFPGAYHSGEKPAFALATEAADLAVEAFTGASSLQEARRRLAALVEGHAKALALVASDLSREMGISFGGIDFSLAPFPDQSHSLGTALELLGVPRLGMHGSLAASAIVAATLNQAKFPQTGFSGMMMPVLEDAVLAARAAEGTLTVKDLLLYSAVCGTGLDTVPLPGDAGEGQLAALLLDLAALACRLNKPLTARLMPVPGKKAGEPTNFDFAYFTNSRIMALEADPLQNLLNAVESFPLTPRKL